MILKIILYSCSKCFCSKKKRRIVKAGGRHIRRKSEDFVIENIHYKSEIDGQGIES